MAVVHPEIGQQRVVQRWFWLDRSHGEHFRRCSWCGSVHPEDLAAEPEWLRTEWADRKYGWPHKLYVDLPVQDGPQLAVVGTRWSSAADDSWIAWSDLTPDQRAVAERDGYGPRGGDEPAPDFVLLGDRVAHHAKFYVTHLADPQLDVAVKRAIEARSGLRFTFTDDGHVRWAPAA
ncbi:hypothetical protein [Cryptosporangium sp. NPDC051539]|uniref:hypothetical protein n=1 Tax=Cryptosporangium sp. NPDC051539 TaxID=3363962 RepID=UPI00379C7BCD